MLLNEALENSICEIISIDEGENILKRLHSMGIYPNVVIKILKNDHFGPLIILLKNVRLSIGRGLAKKIYIEKYEKNKK